MRDFYGCIMYHWRHSCWFIQIDILFILAEVMLCRMVDLFNCTVIVYLYDIENYMANFDYMLN
jgi:hypothetical protein